MLWFRFTEGRGTSEQLQRKQFETVFVTSCSQNDPNDVVDTLTVVPPADQSLSVFMVPRMIL